MGKLQQTILHDKHVEAGAKMVDFAGWKMPVQYSDGIISEHLATRKAAGLFDVSHMGRFAFRGAGAAEFLQHVLTNNALALEVGRSHYTILASPTGGAVDDAYLYRFTPGEYLLIVNAANRRKDWDHFQSLLGSFEDCKIIDRSEELAMVSLQGPISGDILAGLLEAGTLPPPERNALSSAKIRGREVMIGRTGYTGEPICFELFIPASSAAAIWDELVESGACPVGLGARDTLRLEAGLPLYGHELGTDPQGREIPILASPASAFATSFSPSKGEYIGKDAIVRQYEALKKFLAGDFSSIADLPRRIRPLTVMGGGVARAGAKVYVPFNSDKHVGWVTSGTVGPYWLFDGDGPDAHPTDRKAMRSVCLALLDSNLNEGDRVEIDIRGRRTEAMIVPRHLRSNKHPCARAVVYGAKTR